MSSGPHPYASLFQPARIGSLDLRHRILMGSMHLGIEGERGTRERLAEFYLERARGGAALIFTGGVAVHPAGGGDHMFCLTSDEDRDDLRYLAGRIHEVADSRIALQLFHSGRYAKSAETGRSPLAPSAVESKLTGETPQAMDGRDIADVIDSFAAGAAFAQESGFDAVEIMASEGYLLNEFVSPLTNRRDDRWGGDFEGRIRLNLEVMAAIRRSVGADFPVVYRMSGADCMPESTSWEETLELARRLEGAGVDALNVGIGWHESRVPTVAAIVPHGAFATVAAGIRAAVTVPVIGANRINRPDTAAHLVSMGWLDFVAPARPWLADPRLAEKIRENDEPAINTCLACNQSCLDHNFADPPVPVSCLVNPRSGNELRWPAVRAAKRRRVAVVGGGPAGLEAARAAAERGHLVSLFEEQDSLGGQFRRAGRGQGKDEFNETLRYYREMLHRLDVTIELRVRPSASDLLGFDRVILATGVVPALPRDLPGITLPHVVTYPQVFRGQVSLGRRVVIVGSGGIGCDLAHFLGQRSLPDPAVHHFASSYPFEPLAGTAREITVLSRSGRVARGVGRTTRWVLLSELRRLGVTVEREFRPVRIDESGVHGVAPAGERSIEADSVVLCTGQESRNELLAELEGKVEVDVVGGAKKASGINAAVAIREAFEAAYAI